MKLLPPLLMPRNFSSPALVRYLVLGLLPAGFLLYSNSAYAGQCQLKIIDKSWALRAGIHPSRLNDIIVPVGRNYDSNFAEYFYRWMGTGVPASKVRIVANKSQCEHLPEYVGD